MSSKGNEREAKAARKKEKAAKLIRDIYVEIETKLKTEKYIDITISEDSSGKINQDLMMNSNGIKVE